MRITSGEFKNRIILAPEGRNTRPTSERAREALFSILRNRLQDAAFLDLFAGSGAMGLEAVSRGCRKAVLVDSGREAYQVIRKNIAALGVGDRAAVFCTQAEFAISRLTERFDIVFLDPPYQVDCIPKILERLLQYPVLAPGAVVIAEHEAPVEPAKGFAVEQTRKYGRASFTFFHAED